MNYLKTTWRILTRNKTYSLINIGGLAIGVAICWLISLYVYNELQYDRYHPNANRIYRIAQHADWGTGSFHLPVTSAPFADAFKKTFPEVQNAVRLDIEGGGTISYNNKNFNEPGIFFADSSFFRVFGYRFIYGDENALRQPNSIVITRSLALKIFGDPASAFNKLISFGRENCLVTGIIEDVPVNSHFSFSAVRSMYETDNNNWSQAGLYTYLLLHKDADIEKLNAKLPSFYDRYLKTSMEKGAGKMNYHLELQPLTSIHLYSNLEYEIAPNGNMRYVKVFSLVAFLILLIASINYMNLTTARASLRVKEIAVRKVNGSSRKQLIVLFLAESILFTFIASVIAFVLVKFMIPSFIDFIGKPALWQPDIWQSAFFCLVFALIAGCFSGIYPAFFLSGFKLIPSLKGQPAKQPGNLRLRESLVVFQFVITVAMIAGSVIIYQQLFYVSNKDLGFNKNQVLTYHLNDLESRTKVDLIKSALMKNPHIESVAAAGNPIGNNFLGSYTCRIEQNNGSLADKEKQVRVLEADEDFINTMEVKLAAGRNFSSGMSTDKDRSLIINEAFAKNEGWTDPMGKKIQMGLDSLGKPRIYEVIGITKDFNFYSLQHSIEPLILKLPARDRDKDNIYVRISANNIAAGVQHVESVFKQFDAINPFEYSFLDENFAKLYAAEQKQGKLLMVFTILAIVVACLGLFGLITFIAEQKRKEIGIRKVLGSSILDILLLLAKDLIKLVLIAMIIATPIAWFAMNKWLEDFAYRIHIGWWVFAIAGLLGIIIAFATISVKAVKAALANPVRSLRAE